MVFIICYLNTFIIVRFLKKLYLVTFSLLFSRNRCNIIYLRQMQIISVELGPTFMHCVINKHDFSFCSLRKSFEIAHYRAPEVFHIRFLCRIDQTCPVKMITWDSKRKILKSFVSSSKKVPELMKKISTA